MPKPTRGTHFFFLLQNFSTAHHGAQCTPSVHPWALYPGGCSHQPCLVVRWAALHSKMKPAPVPPARPTGVLVPASQPCPPPGDGAPMLLPVVFPWLFHQCPYEQQRSVARTLQSSILSNTQDEGTTQVSPVLAVGAWSAIKLAVFLFVKTCDLCTAWYLLIRKAAAVPSSHRSANNWERLDRDVLLINQIGSIWWAGCHQLCFLHSFDFIHYSPRLFWTLGHIAQPFQVPLFLQFFFCWKKGRNAK